MKTNQIQKNIPPGWQQVKLGDCLVIKHGKPQKEVEVIDGKYPILATGGIIGRTNTPLYSKPSVLIGRKGTIDKPRYMDAPFWTVDTLFYSQIKENSVPKYLFYKFNTIEWYDYNEASGVPSLSATTISSIKFNLPPLAEQNRIVTVLETWDKLIEKLAKKIETKKQIKKALAQDLLTGKKRLSGFTDKWENVELQDICFISMGQSPSSTAYNEKGLGIPLIQGNNDIKNRKTISRIWTTEITKTAQKGDIIMTVRAPVGWIGVATTDVCIGRGVCAIRAKTADHLFVLKLLESLESRWKSFEQGSTFTAVNSSDVKALSLYIPKLKEEQKAIAEILNTADKEIAELEKKLSIIKEQKRYLLNNLITGTIRTPETLSTKLTK